MTTGEGCSVTGTDQHALLNVPMYLIIYKMYGFLTGKCYSISKEILMGNSVSNIIYPNGYVLCRFITFSPFLTGILLTCSTTLLSYIHLCSPFATYAGWLVSVSIFEC